MPEIVGNWHACSEGLSNIFLRLQIPPYFDGRFRKSTIFSNILEIFAQNIKNCRSIRIIYFNTHDSNTPISLAGFKKEILQLFCKKGLNIFEKIIILRCLKNKMKKKNKNIPCAFAPDAGVISSTSTAEGNK
jgi:hypothetical protein